MRRALVLAALALLTTRCVSAHQAATIEGTDLQSRYPEALEEARHGLARTVAFADLLFAGWLAADGARRGADRHRHGGDLLTAGGFVGALTGAWLVTATAGSYPEGDGVPGGGQLPGLDRPGRHRRGDRLAGPGFAEWPG